MNINSDTRILIVDDCSDMRVIVTKILEKEGFKNIRSAKDTNDALFILNQSFIKNEKIQVVLADWQMPERSGIELLREMKEDEKFRDIIFIMLTSVNDSQKVTRAIACGVDNYLLKPVSSRGLISKILKTSTTH